MSKKQKKNLVRIIISICLLVLITLITHFIELPQYIQLIIYLIPYFLIGYDVLKKAIMNIIHGQLFDENFLMSLATIGAFCLSEFTEAVAVMLFYQIGELFQNYAVGKSRKSITQLMDIRPDHANIEKDGVLCMVSPEEIHVGEIIHIKAGEKIPLDGVIVSGKTAVDTSALTGESVPCDLSEGDEVISGCVNMSGLIKVKVTKEFGQSTVAKILDLVENSGAKKAKFENFITKFSKIYTPVVVICAVLLAVLPPLILGASRLLWEEWIGRALTFLVISCPCALVISVPLSFFGGIGGASKCGILIKGGNYMEALSKAKIVVFDKTGTLTKGVFKVTQINSEKISDDKLLEIAALAESFSDHPIAKSVKEAYNKPIDQSNITEHKEIPGFGITAMIENNRIAVGNLKLMEKLGISEVPENDIGTTVHVACNGAYAGCIVISDEIKEQSAKAIEQLKKIGIDKTVMLTGDNKKAGSTVACALGIDLVYTDLLPDNKVSVAEQLLAEKKKKSTLVFVGDGINDAPVLAEADVGIAMGGIGSDAAIEAADIVLMDDDPLKIVSAIRISNRTLKIVKQNIVFAIGVKLMILLLGALGLAGMWLAVFADVGVAVLAILNAMRALKVNQ